MDGGGDEFLKWAEDPVRTLEERYGILLLIESFLSGFRHEKGIAFTNFDEERKQREARAFNPVYEPCIDPNLLRYAAGKLSTLESLSVGGLGEDRPLRDLSFLIFLPALEILRISCLDREDLCGVHHLTSLRSFSLRSDAVEDYSALAACRELREMTVHTFHPWPVLTSLDGHPTLEKLVWHGKLTSLFSIKHLPAMRHLYGGGSFGDLKPQASARDLHALPEMPLLEHFWAGWFYRLDGIERFPKLRFLTVMTLSKSLAPLSCLGQLTHLRVSAPLLEEIATVTAMPSVLHFVLYSPMPQDWGSIVESDSLREVYHWTDFKTENDLETLRLFLPPWDEFFIAAEPRKIEPMRILLYGCDDGEKKKTQHPIPGYPEGEGGWFGNEGMKAAEDNWVGNFLKEALRRAGYLSLQGVRFGPSRDVNVFNLLGLSSSSPTTRRKTIYILGAQAIGELPGICQCLRRALAAIRFRWEIYFMLDPEPDADMWDETWRDESPLSAAEQEAEEERYRDYEKKRRDILLNDQLRLRMLRELGEDISTFKPSPLPSPPIPGETAYEAAPEEENEEAEEDVPNSGGIAEFDEEEAKKDESWLEPPTISDPNIDWNALRGIFQLSVKGIHLHGNDKSVPALAELFDTVPERVD